MESRMNAECPTPLHVGPSRSALWQHPAICDNGSIFLSKDSGQAAKIYDYGQVIKSVCGQGELIYM